MSDLVVAVVTSAVVAAIVSETIGWFKERSRTASAGRLQALQIATALEGYALDCSHKLAAHTTAESSDGAAGSYLGVVPSFPQLSVGEALLRSKKAKLASRLSEFPQEVRQADQEVEFWNDVLCEPGCTRNAAKKHTARIGMSSLTLAKELRREFGLPKRQMKFGDYDIEEHLRALALEPEVVEQ